MESFWNFSIRVYALPQVSERCLKLQDDFGFDVNLILFACWHGRVYGQCDAAVMQRALSFSAIWSSNIVQPLREARRWMKTSAAENTPQIASPKFHTDFQDLRQQIKKLELCSEKFQEDMLESLVSEDPQVLSLEQRTISSVANIRLLATHCSIPMSELLAQTLSELLVSVIDDTDTKDCPNTKSIKNQLTGIVT